MKLLALLALLLAGCTPLVTFQTRQIRNGTECTVWRANDVWHPSIAWVTCVDKSGRDIEPYPQEESSILAPIFDAIGALAP